MFKYVTLLFKTKHMAHAFSLITAINCYTFYKQRKQSMINTQLYKRIIYFLAAMFVPALFFLHSCSGDDDNVFVVPGGDIDENYAIHFIDVGQGDAIFVETPEKVLLVDGGWGDNSVVEYLEGLDIEYIDIVIGTHPHADHIQGLIDVFYTFEVGEVIDPGITHTTQTFHNYLSVIDVYDIPFTVGRKGMEWELSEFAHMKILHPVSVPQNHTGSSTVLNNASIVAHVTLGEVTLLLTGDAEQHAENQMLNEPELLASDILKVGHHGSNTSSQMEFLEAVKPAISVIQCGKDNQHGHPHGPVLQRLNAIDTTIYRTDQHGNIVITITDGVEYEVHTHQ